MFERFTDRARRVVVLSQEEARRLNHNYIGTEHVLLGLLQEEEGIAARVLSSLGVSLDETRDAVEEIIGHGTGSPADHIPFTPRAKKVLELSLREALQLGHNYIGTEHLLLGLLREGEGVAAQVLVRLGAELSQLRSAVIHALEGRPKRSWSEEESADNVIQSLQVENRRLRDEVDRLRAEVDRLRTALLRRGPESPTEPDEPPHGE
jgi:ATP-dependent Clp protease ATP-binding subunit ClpC